MCTATEFKEVLESRIGEVISSIEYGNVEISELKLMLSLYDSLCFRIHVGSIGADQISIYEASER